MYVRDARNRDEVWLLDHIEAMGLDGTAFRSRDYVIAVDENTNERAGFGRIRIHVLDDDSEILELTSIGTLEDWRGQGVGAHVVERLVTKAKDADFETVYALTGAPEYLAQFGFESISADELPEKLQQRLDEKREELEPEAAPVVVEIDDFSIPEALRERFKNAEKYVEPEPEDTAEDFGIDPKGATYKYDTGR
ncbi:MULTISPECIES: GNAT family N-acetyltransferase [unclassified Haladaptatus]|uniref:GNAT family N-acetyltransferase n=1 Tax=unclassified Haladaptatus TaxID=2622732 RepID=UPI0023E8AE79|nr:MULTISPECIES: GNAT family N-acetyltransferase [unclassified Haladaptatus]